MPIKRLAGPVTRSVTASAKRERMTLGNSSAAVLTTQPCAPCMLHAAPVSSSAAPSGPSLRVTAALDEYKSFRAQYGLVAQTQEELAAMLAGKYRGAVLPPRVTPEKFISLPTFPLWFLPNETGKPNTPVRIFSTLFDDANRLDISLPGEYTPTCDGMHIPDFMNPAKLRDLKAAGIDVIVITTPGRTDSTTRWIRDHLAKANLSHLMPSSLPGNDLDARIAKDPDMPRFMIHADSSLAKLNAMGLVFVPEKIDDENRLGFAAQRSFAVFRGHELLDLVVAENPRPEKCSAVLVNAVLARLQTLKAKQTLSLVAAL